MCGLAGIFFPKNVEPLKADLDAMLTVMAHRGPDGTACFTNPDRRYRAGFKRLAIIDLTTGNQPIVENDGTRVLMGNGEIYNYRELKQMAAASGYSYQTSGDMEVILPLAGKYGQNFLDHLNGMFALALYERDSHTLLLARDRLGIKSLYWTRLHNGGIAFASEIKALFASGLVSPEVEETAIDLYLRHGYVPAPLTLFKGIRKIPPGHRLNVGAEGTAVLESYWSAKPSDSLPVSGGDIEDHIAFLLRDSVRLQLRSDVPVGALLSGGIDSGLMVAMAAAQTDRPLQTFTVSFEGAAVDEAPLAASVARRYSTEHTELSLAAATATWYLPRLAWFCDEPVNDPALLPNFLIQEALGKYGKVALNGTGGDELFAGYGRYFQTPVEKAYLRLPSVIRRSMERSLDSISPLTAWKLRRAEKFSRHRGAYLHEHTTFFPPPLLDLIGRPVATAPSRQETDFRDYDGDADSAALFADLNSYLPEDLLLLLDRTSMAFGVEGRVPFLDHRLVEAALAIPSHIRAPGGRQKALLRSIARNYLPEPVVTAPKQGFASPVPAWFDAGLDTVARRLLKRPTTLQRGWWTAEGVERLLADHHTHAFRLYALIMLELTVRIHIESPVSMSAPSADLADFADAS